MSKAPKKKFVPRQKSLIMPEVQNPFSYRLNMTVCDKIKVAFCTVTLFPVRLLCCVLLCLLASLFGLLATACLQKKEEQEPFTGFRKALRTPMRLCARGILFCMGFHWVKVKGKLSSPADAPILVVAPHSSFVDALALASLCVSSGVSKKENDNIPLVGACFRALQPVYVSRTDVNSRKKAIEDIKKRATSGGRWPHLVIFPEGTCTNRKCLITFKPGSFYAGTPVQPVILRYPNRLDTVTWTWSGPRALTLLWLTMCQFHNCLEIEILPVYKPDTEEIQDAKLFARNVRKQMASSLKIPVTEHTYEDCRLMLQATHRKLPAEAGLVEYQKISTKLSVRMDSMKELLTKFSEMDENRDGLVDLQEFAKYLKLPLTTHVEELFSLYDRDDSGWIDFREYLIGMSLVSQPANSEEAIQLAFKVFDVKGDGHLDEPELRQVIQSAYPSTPDLDVSCLFKQVDVNHRGSVTYEEFRDFALSHPEYAVLFQSHQQKTAGDNSNSGAEENMEGEVPA